MKMMMLPFRKRPPRLGRCQIFIGFLDHSLPQDWMHTTPESNMEPEDDPFEKGNHLPNLNSQVPFFLMGSVCLYICNVYIL